MFFFFNGENETEVRKKKCTIEKERNSINLSNILKNVIYYYHSIKRYRFFKNIFFFLIRMITLDIIINNLIKQF